MAGRPARRARNKAYAAWAAQHYHEKMTKPDLKIPSLPDYFATVGAPPVRNLPIPGEPPPPASLAEATKPAPRKAADVPLTREDAETFAKMRSVAMKRMLAFLEMEIDEYKPNAEKMKMKQLEIAQAVAALGGRVDPGSYRKPADDDIGEILNNLKGTA